ncbi:MAG TPA: hypothetical protein VIC04_06745 [Terriglobia bacterium]|jgi:hypothetical protein
MEREQPYHPESDQAQPNRTQTDRESDEHCLPTISLIHVAHPRIANLYQCCFEYIEPWQWSPVAELVETGRWFFKHSDK